MEKSFKEKLAYHLDNVSKRVWIGERIQRLSFEKAFYNATLTEMRYTYHHPRIERKAIIQGLRNFYLNQ